MQANDIRIAQDRFYGKKWGIFNHFLYVIQNNPKYPNSYGKQTDWDTLVKEFDVETLAKNLHEMGGGVLRNYCRAGDEIYDCAQRYV